METTFNGWKVFDARAPILTFEYSFGLGMATALAVGGVRGLVVVSPPCGVPARVREDLAAYGPVTGLVASNAFHYMGIPEWKAQFPDAEVFAPQQSVARVERRVKLTGIRPLADAAAITGPRLDLMDMPHYKTGEVLVRIVTERGLVWYVTDFLMNMPVLPQHPVPRLLFQLTHSAPGLKFNNVAPLFMVRDKGAPTKSILAR